MKYKDSQGNWVSIALPSLDSMPVGTIVDYDGQTSDIPNGWQTYGTGQIKKISQTTPTSAQIVDGYNTSTTDGYSSNYINNNIASKVLYEDNTGTLGNISLNDNVDNYNYFVFSGVDKDSPTSTSMNMIMFKGIGNTLKGSIPTVESGSVSITTRKYTYSGSNLTFASQYHVTTAQGLTNPFSYSNFIVRKIIGYK